MQPAEATTPLRTIAPGHRGRRPIMGATVPFRTFMKVRVDQLWPELKRESSEHSVAANVTGLEGRVSR